MIIHADMDAYYASVEIRDNPALADKPVVVAGAADRRGVVSAASYIARQYGIHSAMPTARAVKLCPDLIIVPHRIDYYADVARQIRAIFGRYTPVIEPLSLDEAFLDVTASEHLFGSAEIIGRRIKQDIATELNLVVSVGIAPNKFIAKIASDIEKPNGFVMVSEAQIQTFLDPLPVSRIWGVGKVAEQQLHKQGIYKIADLRRLSESNLIKHFGKHGSHLWQLANGIDERSVCTERETKSISHETTFAVDQTDQALLLSQLFHLTEQVAVRLRNEELKGRTIQIKVRYSDFRTLTRAHSLDTVTDATKTIWQIAKMLFQERLPATKDAIRLIGVGVSGLDEHASITPEQDDLFAEPTKEKQTSAVDKLADEINKKLGSKAVLRGRSVIRSLESDNER